jgi:hypothetical protein
VRCDFMRGLISLVAKVWFARGKTGMTQGAASQVTSLSNTS